MIGGEGARNALVRMTLPCWWCQGGVQRLCIPHECVHELVATRSRLELARCRLKHTTCHAIMLHFEVEHGCIGSWQTEVIVHCREK